MSRLSNASVSRKSIPASPISAPGRNPAAMPRTTTAPCSLAMKPGTKWTSRSTAPRSASLASRTQAVAKRTCMWMMSLPKPSTPMRIRRNTAKGSSQHQGLPAATTPSVWSSGETMASTRRALPSISMRSRPSAATDSKRFLLRPSPSKPWAIRRSSLLILPMKRPVALQRAGTQAPRQVPPAPSSRRMAATRSA